MNARNKLAEGATLYIDGKPFGIVDEPRFVSELNGIEKWEMTVQSSECTWTAPPERVAVKLIDVGYMAWVMWATSSLETTLLIDSKQLAPPKRPPNPERPMWAINPGRTRRNAFGPSRRVK